MFIGFVPEMRDAFASYDENPIVFITDKNIIQNIMKKFELLDCVEGTFDYGYVKLGQYKFNRYDKNTFHLPRQYLEKFLKSL